MHEWRNERLVVYWLVEYYYYVMEAIVLFSLLSDKPFLLGFLESHISSNISIGIVCKGRAQDLSSRSLVLEYIYVSYYFWTWRPERSGSFYLFLSILIRNLFRGFIDSELRIHFIQILTISGFLGIFYSLSIAWNQYKCSYLQSIYYLISK